MSEQGQTFVTDCCTQDLFNLSFSVSAEMGTSFIITATEKVNLSMYSSSLELYLYFSKFLILHDCGSFLPSVQYSTLHEMTSN